MLPATNEELPSQLQCGPVKLITELLVYDLDHFMDCGSQVTPIRQLFTVPCTFNSQVFVCLYSCNHEFDNYIPEMA